MFTRKGGPGGLFQNSTLFMQAFPQSIYFKLAGCLIFF
jgi:hypothetical protein